MIMNWIAASIVIATSLGLLLSRDWRWTLGILAVQYVGVFWLIQVHWPLGMAAVKLVTGWMASTTLGMAQLRVRGIPSTEISWPEGRAFRSFTGGLVILVSLALASRIIKWLAIDWPVAWGGTLLIGMGLLQLGITAQPLRVIVGLLTALSGFEIIYATVESSVLVTASLAVVTLGLALTGAYLLLASSTEETG